MDLVAECARNAFLHKAVLRRPLVHATLDVVGNCRHNVWYRHQHRSSADLAQRTLNLKNCDPEDVRDRFIMSGPVARSLLSKNKMNATTIEDVIKQALANDLFEFATSNIDLPCPTSHQMFLIRPAEVFDAAGKPSFIRQNRSLHFVSNYVASRTVELMEQRFDNVRKHLADALDIDATRPAAGKLVESILHRALVERKIDLPPAFGGGQVAQGLELIGNTDNFILQTRAQDHRPLYLRPQLPDFGAADAILVTETALCFLQCSLSSSHSCVGKTLLQVLDRLDTSEKIVVDSRKLLYCVVGMDEGRVKQLGREEAQKLKALQAQGLGNLSSIAVTRLRRLEVVGFTLGELMEHVELKVVEMVDGDEDCVPDEVEIQSDKGKGKGRKRRQHVVDGELSSDVVCCVPQRPSAGFGDEDDGPTTTASTGGSPKRQKDNDLNRKNRIRGRGRPTASGQQFRPS
ncbi:hypothetical protein C8F01DRAFT_382403 [Mycena amicta]|nr:hypothetical protein C8F01DRAFT_382403 [Mycena amicta]